MEPWLQMVLTVFSSVLASSGLWAYIQKHENLNDYLYMPYAKMGDNWSAKRIMNEIDKLPIHN